MVFLLQWLTMSRNQGYTTAARHFLYASASSILTRGGRCQPAFFMPRHCVVSTRLRPPLTLAQPEARLARSSLSPKPRQKGLPLNRSQWHVRVGSLVIFWLAVAVILTIIDSRGGGTRWFAIHAFALGAVSNALLIWTGHFTDAILRARVLNHRGEAAVLAVANIGVLGIGFGAELGIDPLLGAGCAVFASAIVAHAWRLRRKLATALPARFTMTVHAYFAATCLLVPGLFAGWLMTADILPEGWFEGVRAAHITLNILGWVVVPIIGTLLTLWPTVLHTPLPPRAELVVKAHLPYLVGAVVITALAAIVAGHSTAAAITVGLGYFAFAALGVRMLWPLIRATWRIGRTDFSALSIAAGTLWLAGTIIVSAVRMLLDTPFTVMSSLASFVLPLLAGGVAQVLLGSLSYLLPVMAGGGPGKLRVRMRRVSYAAPVRVAVFNLLLISALTTPSVAATRVCALATVAVGVVALIELAWALMPVSADAEASARAAANIATPSGASKSDPKIS